MVQSPTAFFKSPYKVLGFCYNQNSSTAATGRFVSWSIINDTREMTWQNFFVLLK